MATNPETRALLEMALQHVLAEQSKLLKHDRHELLIRPVQKLGDLAASTWNCLLQGLHKIHSTAHLTKHAREIESMIDDISEKHWMFINISVSSIYEKIQHSFKLLPYQETLKLKTALSIRNHFHNLRILLLEQLLGARMLINNNDYGSEVERVWQQFFQRELGPEFRVLQGGHVLDYDGNDGKAQIDLLIVPSDAQIMTPSSSEGGKVNVLCDQVIAAIMTTSNLTAEKFCDDWNKLKQISDLFKLSDELPHAFQPEKQQAWPLCYLATGQSVLLTELMKEWVILAEASPESKFVPQFVLSLDSGYLYSGATSWPRPRFPSNYVNPNQVVEEQGIYAGLGIAWLLTQIRARAKLLENKPFNSIQRFTKLLDKASLKSATPPMWSPRFNTMFLKEEIEGLLRWGHVVQFPHNRLLLSSLQIHHPEPKKICNVLAPVENGDVSKLPWHGQAEHVRWFRHGIHFAMNGIVAIQEWKKNPTSNEYCPSYAFFDSATGEEIILDKPLGNVHPDEVKKVLSNLRDKSQSGGGS